MCEALLIDVVMGNELPTNSNGEYTEHQNRSADEQFIGTVHCSLLKLLTVYYDRTLLVLMSLCL